METNFLSQLANKPVTVATATTATKPEAVQPEKSAKQSMSSSAKLGLTLTGLAVLGTASYLICKGKGNKKVLAEIKDLTKDFKPFYEDATKKVETILKGGRAKITYSGIDKDGSTIREIIVLNKDKSITRILQKKNKETGKFLQDTLKGSKDEVLQPLSDVPNKNFVKTVKKDAFI